jgi:hypothetical protein
MASFLEASKLTVAALLHTYWDKLGKLARTYYIISLVILSLLTSMGIYGMLSSGYQDTANKMSNTENQLALVKNNRNNIKEQLASYNLEKININDDINGLRLGLSNNTIQYKDKETGQIITTTSSSTRKSLENQLTQTSSRQDVINLKIDELNSQLFEYEHQIMEIQNSNSLNGEIGPLKYLSNLTNLPMDKIINVLLLTIIFVFDPLAISLVIAASYAFENSSPKTENGHLIKKSSISKEEQHQHIVDIMKADEESGLYDKVDVSSDNEEKETESTLSPLTQKEIDLLENNSISSWRKNKIKAQKLKKSPEDLIKIY